jgi:hypothetical protein
VDKNGQKFLASFVFFNKLPNEKNRRIGENSSNLVTLAAVNFPR